MANSLVEPAAVIASLMRYVAERVRGAGEMILDNQFAVRGAGSGYVLNYRLPMHFNPMDPVALAPVHETMLQIPLNTHIQVPMDIADQDLTLPLSVLDHMFLEPAAEGLARKLLRSWPLGHVLACCTQERPGGCEWSEVLAHFDAQLCLRVVRGYDMRSNRKHTQADMLVGFGDPDKNCPVELIESPRLQALKKMKADLETQRALLKTGR